MFCKILGNATEVNSRQSFEDSSYLNIINQKVKSIMVTEVSQEFFHHIFQSKPKELSGYGRVKYKVDRRKESQIVGNQTNQIENTNTCTE